MLAAVGVVAIAVVFGLGFIFSVYWSLRSSEVKVPDVVGKDRYVAENELTHAGLNFRVRAWRPSNQTKADSVLFQLPRAGELVKVGQTVAVDVSRAAKEGEASETIPDSNSNKASENRNSNASTAANANENKPPRNKNANSNNANANGNANTANRNANANANANRHRPNANTSNVNDAEGNVNRRANSNRTSENSSPSPNANRANVNRPTPTGTPPR